jgi:hypothetical protein
MDAEVMEGYSGRGMYGKETTGVVLDRAEDAIVAVIQQAHLFVEGEEDDDALYDAITDLTSISRDNMGIRTVIY